MSKNYLNDMSVLSKGDNIIINIEVTSKTSNTISSYSTYGIVTRSTDLYLDTETYLVNDQGQLKLIRKKFRKSNFNEGKFSTENSSNHKSYYIYKLKGF